MEPVLSKSGLLLGYVDEFHRRRGRGERCKNMRAIVLGLSIIVTFLPAAFICTHSPLYLDSRPVDGFVSSPVCLAISLGDMSDGFDRIILKYIAVPANNLYCPCLAVLVSKHFFRSVAVCLFVLC